MKLLSKLIAISAAGVGLLALAAPAQAISINPGSPGVIGRNLGPSNCQPGCVYSTFGLVNDGSLTLLYKADAADEGSTPTSEEGTFRNSYDTMFTNSRQNSTITFTGGSSINCGVCYLVIKDGNHNPSYYFYDLTAAGWNGTDAIVMTGFWPGPGAISHVAIWGSSVRNSVPEPGTLGLLGFGLAGMGIGLRRRRKR